jgi:hypothetical protein
MSVNTYVTGKQEVDDTSKHVGYRKLTMSARVFTDCQLPVTHVFTGIISFPFSCYIRIY